MGPVPRESCVSVVSRFTNGLACFAHETLVFLETVFDFTSKKVPNTTFCLMTHSCLLRGRVGYAIYADLHVR